MQKLTPHNKFADTLLRKTEKMSQKFTVLAEFSAVLAEFSTSIAKKTGKRSLACQVWPSLFLNKIKDFAIRFVFPSPHTNSEYASLIPSQTATRKSPNKFGFSLALH